MQTLTIKSAFDLISPTFITAARPKWLEIVEERPEEFPVAAKYRTRRPPDEQERMQWITEKTKAMREWKRQHPQELAGITQTTAPSPATTVPEAPVEVPAPILSTDEASAEPAPTMPTETPIETEAPSANIAQLSQGLMQAVRQFAAVHNQQIRTYNPAIKQINQALKQIQQTPHLTYQDPNVATMVTTLTNALTALTTEEQADTGRLNQLAQQATALSQAVGGAAAAGFGGGVGRPGGAASGAGAGGVGTPTAPLGTGRGEGVGEWFGNLRNLPQNIMRGYRRAREPQQASTSGQKRILTAAMGSAKKIIRH